MYPIHPELAYRYANERVEEMRRSAEDARQRRAIKRQRHRQRRR
jgi:hypothetical protein